MWCILIVVFVIGFAAIVGRGATDVFEELENDG